MKKWRNEKMKTLVINEKDVGYVKIYKDEVKYFGDYRDFKNLPNAIVEREGTADEYVVFKTFDSSKAAHRKSYLLQERNSWYETASAINLGVFSSIENALKAAKKILDEEFSPDAYNIGVNNGSAAGQSVMHLHVHLIPRYKGDVEDPKGGVRWILKDKANYWDNKATTKRVT